MRSLRVRSLPLLTTLLLASACPSDSDASTQGGAAAKTSPSPAPPAAPAPAPAPTDPFDGPAPAPMAPAPMAPAPLGVVDEEVAINPAGTTSTPCTAMTAPQLDFVVDTVSGDITSVEANAMIGRNVALNEVTLHATNTGTTSNVSIAVLVTGSGSATVVDSKGTVQTVTRSPTGGATPLTVVVNPDSTFSITSTTTMTTIAPEKSDEGGDHPNPTPASPKKAVIKPVPTCPG